MLYRLEKNKLNEFLEKIKEKNRLIAPVKTDLVRFEEIKDVKDIELKKRAYYPIKNFFFKNNEEIFSFKKDETIVPKIENPSTVFLGLRMCDLNGVMRQDMIFEDDPYYQARRKNTYLIGIGCNEPQTKYCFCGSMDLKPYFDIMLKDKGKYFLIIVGSKKGEQLKNKLKSFLETTNEKITHKKSKTDRLKKIDISRLYDHKDWKKGVDKCLSCSACTASCPTCYCFEFHDEIKSSNCKEGCRKRCWSSCQLQEFTKVAGDHVFREKREERFKHRIYHQLQYFKEKHGINLCVGCGRCISNCPTKIDFVNIINNMKNGKK